MVLLDPRGRQRWKECAVQPVNTLTQRGKKTSYKQKLSHHPEPPPPAVYTCREGGREGGGGGGGGRMKRMGRRGMKTAERWKKVLNGKKKRGEKVDGQKKNERKNAKDAF